MSVIGSALQLIIAGGLLNVWLFRNSKSTHYRGGSAKNLKEEFQTYGLPDFVYYIVGFLKITSALILLAGFWMPSLNLYAASIVAFLMFGALSMHIKAKDPFKKSIPALAMLIMSLILVYISSTAFI